MNEEKRMKAILITGASTGIGRQITETLSQNGFYIYAGARKQNDLDELNLLDNVQSVKLDVNDLDQIEAAVNLITADERELFGLINNAGVMDLQPINEVSDSDFDWQMQTNVYGPFRVTKAFSQQLIKSKGRIINIGSISGVLSSALLGPYSMTKRAIDSFSDTLNSEMSELGVSVSIIEPGDFDSEMDRKFVDMVQQSPQKYLKTEYPVAKEYFDKVSQDGFSFPDSPNSLPVALAVLDAFTSPNPKPRYLVVPTQEQAEMTIRKALQEAVQLNHNQPYSYKRDELIAMLDELLFDLLPK